MIMVCDALRHLHALGQVAELFACRIADQDGGTMRRLMVFGSALPLPEDVSSAIARTLPGEAIYIRSAAFDGPIVLDDLDAAAIERMSADGIPTLCTVETSSGNYQAWITLPAMRGGLRTRGALLRKLAQIYGADEMAATPRQLGRLAGTPSGKPGRGGFVARLERLPPPAVPAPWLSRTAAEIEEAWSRRLETVVQNDAIHLGVPPLRP